MRSLLPPLLASAVLAGTCLADDSNGKPPDKPAIKWDLDKIQEEYEAHLPVPSKYTIKNGPTGKLPEACIDRADAYKVSAGTVEAFEVTYEDCSQSWLMCRAKDSTITKDDMAKTFGRMTLGMREDAIMYTVWKDVGEGSEAVTSGDVVAFNEDNVHKIKTLQHELGHCKDQGKHATADWQNAYNQDAATVSENSQWSELFAEVGTIALLDDIVDGGMGAVSVNKDTNKVSHQVSKFKELVGDALKPDPGRQCQGRKANPTYVDISSKKRSVFRFHSRDFASWLNL
ncbi:hypothetical protein F4778DRAFT_61449 [Xylariomycetidae sp. FL2044]|nr:hypothetical protein F4778DRAFT_61449 [Xylariomycetidae sp. FL2044]